MVVITYYAPVVGDLSLLVVDKEADHALANVSPRVIGGNQHYPSSGLCF